MCSPTDRPSGSTSCNSANIETNQLLFHLKNLSYPDIARPTAITIEKRIEIDASEIFTPKMNSNTGSSDDDGDSSTASESESEDNSIGGGLGCIRRSNLIEWEALPNAPPSSECESELAPVNADMKTPINEKKSVSFGNLEFRKYGMILGDHPDCLVGPPITLDWQYQKESVIVPVETWETCRTPRRQGDALLMSSKRRQYILREVATIDEMRASITEVKRVQKLRRSSYRRCREGGNCFWLSILFGGGLGLFDCEQNKNNSMLILPQGAIRVADI